MVEDKILVENINTPGRTSRVNRAKYEAMYEALMAVLPLEAPGMTFKEAKEAAKASLPQDLFPAGSTSGWWAKTVHLDLEAKGVAKRADSPPVRLYLTGKTV